MDQPPPSAVSSAPAAPKGDCRSVSCQAFELDRGDWVGRMRSLNVAAGALNNNLDHPPLWRSFRDAVCEAVRAAQRDYCRKAEELERVVDSIPVIVDLSDFDVHSDGTNDAPATVTPRCPISRARTEIREMVRALTHPAESEPVVPPRAHSPQPQHTDGEGLPLVALAEPHIKARTRALTHFSTHESRSPPTTSVLSISEVKQRKDTSTRLEVTSSSEVVATTQECSAPPARIQRAARFRGLSMVVGGAYRRRGASPHSPLLAAPLMEVHWRTANANPHLFRPSTARGEATSRPMEAPQTCRRARSESRIARPVVSTNEPLSATLRHFTAAGHHTPDSLTSRPWR